MFGFQFIIILQVPDFEMPIKTWKHLQKLSLVYIEISDFIQRRLKWFLQYETMSYQTSPLSCYEDGTLNVSYVDETSKTRIYFTEMSDLCFFQQVFSISVFIIV